VRDRGSVLLLMPAGVLVVLALGAITVDLAIVHLAERDLITAATDAANDGATAGLDLERYRLTGSFELDPERTTRAVRASLDAAGVLDRLDRPPDIRIVGRREVRVVLRTRAEYVFADAIPGTPRSTFVEARGIARADVG
jgi:hypothetical protein